MATKKEDLTVKNEVVPVDAMPAYIKKDTNRGNEHVTADDLTMPRLDLAQAISAACKKNRAEYIEGLEPGQFYNSVTRKNYGDSVALTFFFFEVKYYVWKKGLTDNAMAEFRGSFSTVEDAQEKIEWVSKEEKTDANRYSIERTALHYAVLEEGEELTPIVITMAKSKAKVSKMINSMVSQFGGDRFSRKYLLSSTNEVSKVNGTDFAGIKVSPAGFPSQAAYEKAEQLYNLASKAMIKVDETVEHLEEDEAAF